MILGQPWSGSQVIKGIIALLLLASLVASLLSSSSSSFSSSFSSSSSYSAHSRSLSNAAPLMMMKSAMPASANAEMMTMEADSAPQDGGGGASGGGSGAEITPAQMVIRTLHADVQVQDVEETRKVVEAFVLESKGNVVSSTSYSTDHVSLAVRVPAALFDKTVEFVRQLAPQTARLTIQGQDITEEFVDQSARLSTSEKTRDRLVKLIEKADKVTDVLAIEREVNLITERIEGFKARVNYLKQSTALSSININIQKIGQVVVEPGRSVFRTFHQAFDLLASVFFILVDTAVYFVVFSVPLGLLGCLVYVVRGVVKRN